MESDDGVSRGGCSPALNSRLIFHPAWPSCLRWTSGVLRARELMRKLEERKKEYSCGNKSYVTVISGTNRTSRPSCRTTILRNVTLVHQVPLISPMLTSPFIDERSRPKIWSRAHDRK